MDWFHSAISSHSARRVTSGAVLEPGRVMRTLATRPSSLRTTRTWAWRDQLARHASKPSWRVHDARTLPSLQSTSATTLPVHMAKYPSANATPMGCEDVTPSGMRQRHASDPSTATRPTKREPSVEAHTMRDCVPVAPLTTANAAPSPAPAAHHSSDPVVPDQARTDELL